MPIEKVTKTDYDNLTPEEKQEIDEHRKKVRACIRWHLAYTLINNPNLFDLRKDALKRLTQIRSDSNQTSNRNEMKSRVEQYISIRSKMLYDSNANQKTILDSSSRPSLPFTENISSALVIQRSLDQHMQAWREKKVDAIHKKDSVRFVYGHPERIIRKPLDPEVVLAPGRNPSATQPSTPPFPIDEIEQQHISANEPERTRTQSEEQQHRGTSSNPLLNNQRTETLVEERTYIEKRRQGHQQYERIVTETSTLRKTESNDS